MSWGPVVGTTQFQSHYETADDVLANYGDLSSSWSIVFDARLSRPLSAHDVRRRLVGLWERSKHLGQIPVVETVEGAKMDELRDRCGQNPYVGDQLLRCGVSDDGRRLILAVHHGLLDGLGLLSVLGTVLNESLISDARGLGQRPARTSFLLGSAVRVLEALLRPPRRFASGPPARVDGPDLVEERHGDGLAHVGSGALAAAVVRGCLDVTPPSRRPIVLSIGASRRPEGVVPTPDRQTALLRIRVRDALAVRDALRCAFPEPDFPQKPAAGGLVPLAVRLLRGRLGSTATVSNLGRIRSDAASSLLERLILLPPATGVAGLAVGVTTVGSTTTLAVRGQAAAFDTPQIQRICDAVWTHFSGDD